MEEINYHPQYAHHVLTCMSASVSFMVMTTDWSKREAREILEHCKALKKQVAKLEQLAEQALKTENKVLRFEKPAKKSN